MERDDDDFSDEADNIYSEVRSGGTSELPAGSPQHSMFEIEINVEFFRRQTADEEEEESSEQESVTMNIYLSLLLSVLLQSPQALHSAMTEVLCTLLVRPPRRRAAQMVDEILEFCRRMAVGEPSDGRFMRVDVYIEVLVDELPSGEGISELRFGDHYSADDDVRFVAAREEAIAGLEKIRVRVSEKECVVCLEDISVGSEATLLPCSHHFHGDCIIKWLNISKFCPLCRFELPS